MAETRKRTAKEVIVDLSNEKDSLQTQLRETRSRIKKEKEETLGLLSIVVENFEFVLKENMDMLDDVEKLSDGFSNEFKEAEKMICDEIKSFANDLIAKNANVVPQENGEADEMKMKQLSMTVERQKKDISRFQEKLKELEDENRELGQIALEFESVEQDMKRKDQRIEKQKRENEHFLKEIQQLKKNVRVLNSDLKKEQKLKEEFENSKKEFSIMQFNLQKSDNKIKQLEKENEKLKEKVDEKSKEKLENEIKSLQQTLAEKDKEYLSALHSKKEEHEKHEKEMMNQKAKIEELLNINSTKEQETQKLKEEMMTMIPLNELENAKKQIEDLKKNLLQQAEKYSSLEKKNAELILQHKEVEGKKEVEQEESAKILKENIQNLENEVNQKNEEIQKLSEEVEEVKKKMIESENQLSEKGNKLEEYEKKIQNLENELESNNSSSMNEEEISREYEDRMKMMEEENQQIVLRLQTQIVQLNEHKGNLEVELEKEKKNQTKHEPINLFGVIEKVGGIKKEIQEIKKDFDELKSVFLADLVERKRLLCDQIKNEKEKTTDGMVEAISKCIENLSTMYETKEILSRQVKNMKKEVNFRIKEISEKVSDKLDGSAGSGSKSRMNTGITESLFKMQEQLGEFKNDVKEIRSKVEKMNKEIAASYGDVKSNMVMIVGQIIQMKDLEIDRLKNQKRNAKKKSSNIGSYFSYQKGKKRGKKWERLWVHFHKDHNIYLFKKESDLNPFMSIDCTGQIDVKRDEEVKDDFCLKLDNGEKKGIIHRFLVSNAEELNNWIDFILSWKSNK